MIDYFVRLVRFVVVYAYKFIHWSRYKNQIKLYGVPRIVSGKNLSIGRLTRINEGVFIHAAGGVILSKNVTLSYGVTILSTGYETKDWNRRKFSKEHAARKVIILDDVWLCANVTVLSGVEIAEGIIVGAGSVVNKSLTQKNSLYAGVPAKFIKKLE